MLTPRIFIDALASRRRVTAPAWAASNLRLSTPLITWIVLAGLPCGMAAGLIGAATGAASPLIALGLPFALGLVVLAAVRPIWVLYLALLAIPLEPIVERTGLGISLNPNKVLVLVATSVWLIKRVFSKEAIRISPRIVVPTFLLIASMVPGILIAPEPRLVIKQLGLWSAFFLAYLMVAADGDDRVVRNLLVALGISGGVVGLISIISPRQGPDIPRALGPFSQPDTLAAFLILAIPTQIAMMLRGPRRLRVALGICLALSLIGVAVSISRGAFIGLVGAVAIMLLWRPFRRFAALASAALIVLLVSGFNPAARVLNLHDAINRIAELGNSSSQPVYLREQVYETAPRIALDHPLFGVGALQFPDVAPRYGLTNSAFTEHEVGNPHDIYLHIATNLGFVGLFSLGWLAIALVRSLGIACRTLRGQAQAMAFALAGAFLAMAFAGLTNDFINADPIMGALFMLVGCVSVLGDKRRDHGPLPTPPLTHNKC